MHTTIQSAQLIISDRIENKMALSVTELCAVQGMDKRLDTFFGNRRSSLTNTQD